MVPREYGRIGWVCKKEPPLKRKDTGAGEGADSLGKCQWTGPWKRQTAQHITDESGCDTTRLRPPKTYPITLTRAAFDKP
jgi:hypothetical protein